MVMRWEGRQGGGSVVAAGSRHHRFYIVNLSAFLVSDDSSPKLCRTEKLQNLHNLWF